MMLYFFILYKNSQQVKSQQISSQLIKSINIKKETQDNLYSSTSWMKVGMQSSRKVLCTECNKSFNSNVELKIHQKVKHKEAFPQKNDNVNSSDLSEDEQEGIKRLGEQFVKKTPNSNYEASKKSQQNQDELAQMTEGIIKNNMPGRFDDPSIIQNELKKVYLCGCEHKTFDTTAALSMHIKKLHNGFPPEGTLYGVCRQLVRRQFQPLQVRQPVIRPHIEKTAFICGCGLSYTRVSSLRYHIRHNHDGVPPFGTIGLTKGPLLDKENGNHNAQFSDSRSSNENKEEKEYVGLKCRACSQPCFQCQWMCQTCDEWRICSNCPESKQIVREHQARGHIVCPGQS